MKFNVFEAFYGPHEIESKNTIFMNIKSYLLLLRFIIVQETWW